MTLKTELMDVNGKKVKAITVFTHAIRFLKTDLEHLLDSRGTGFMAEDIHWMLTVPAIWEDQAKQFMREAAQRVIIIS